MTYPVCVRLVRPDLDDRPLVYSWMTGVAEGAPDDASDPSRAMEQPPISYEDFLGRFPTHYFEHSDKAQGRLFLVAVGDQVVGAIVHDSVRTTDDNRRFCRLALWLAGSSLKGRGIGTHALEHLCERLPNELGIEEAALWTSAGNIRALRAYRRAGFTPSAQSSEHMAERYGQMVSLETEVCLVRALSRGPEIVRVEDGFDRSQLMGLFRFADESDASILRYRDQGVLHVLYGDGGEIVGQILVCRHAYAASATIESVALEKSYRRKGLGSALVRGVLARLTDEGVSQVEVGTAAGDTSNLRFYQYLGFRLRTVQRDFFRPPHYPVSVDPECIPLQDRVVCDIALTSAAVRDRNGVSK